MRWIVIAIIVGCSGCGGSPATTTAAQPAAPVRPAKLACPGQFVDEVSGGVVHSDGTSDHAAKCREFPPPCNTTPTCDCMHELGYRACSVDSVGQMTIIELRPAARPATE